MGISSKGVRCFRQVIVEGGDIKLIRQEVFKRPEMCELIESKVARVTNEDVFDPQIRFVITLPDEEIKALKRILSTENGVMVKEIITEKIGLSQIKEWVDLGLVKREVRDGLAYLVSP